MNRRNFLKTGSLAGLSFTTLSIPALKSNKIKENNKGEVITDSFDLEGITIAELQKKFESGQLTSHSLTQIYLDRIQKIDKNGPGLNSVIEINPDALSIADMLDQERKNKKVRGPLHGMFCEYCI